MDDFIVRTDLRGALEIYLFLVAREGDLEGGTAKLLAAVRSYLYERLSIEDMQAPAACLARLDAEAR
jgi:hypothetical protein